MIIILSVFQRKPFLAIMAVGLLIMCLSVVSIDIVSAAHGYRLSDFDMNTDNSLGDLTSLELMSETTLPAAFVSGVFMAVGGLSGWLLMERQDPDERRLVGLKKSFESKNP